MFLSNFENNDIKHPLQRTQQKLNTNKLPDIRTPNKLYADFRKFTTKYDEPKNIYTDHNFDGVKIISRISFSSLNNTENDPKKSLDTTKTTFYLAQAAPLRTIDLTYKQRENAHANTHATPSTIASTTITTTTTTTTTTSTPTIDTDTTIATSTTTKQPFLIRIY